MFQFQTAEAVKERLREELNLKAPLQGTPCMDYDGERLHLAVAGYVNSVAPGGSGTFEYTRRELVDLMVDAAQRFRDIIPETAMKPVAVKVELEFHPDTEAWGARMLLNGKIHASTYDEKVKSPEAAIARLRLIATVLDSVLAISEAFESSAKGALAKAHSRGGEVLHG